MKKTILVILIFLLGIRINAQQDPQYTQYMYNMNVINPAYAGSTDATSGNWQIDTSPSVSYGTNGFFICKDGYIFLDSRKSNIFLLLNETFRVR